MTDAPKPTAYAVWRRHVEAENTRVDPQLTMQDIEFAKRVQAEPNPFQRAALINSNPRGYARGADALGRFEEEPEPPKAA